MKSLCFFYFFCYKINSEVCFYALSVCKTVYENTKPATVRVALICATKPRFSAWMVLARPHDKHVRTLAPPQATQARETLV